MTITDRDAYVYKITCTPTGKVYVGSTYDLGKRCYEHILALECGTHVNAHLQSAWKIHGIDAFAFDVLERTIASERFAREFAWMEALDACNPEHGFNKQTGAHGVPINGRLGKRNSDEHNARIRAANTGRIMPRDAVEKMRASRLLNPSSELHKQRTTEANRRERAGKTYEEIFGEDKARALREKRSEQMRALWAEGRMESVRASRPSAHKGKTYEEIYGDSADAERAKRREARSAKRVADYQ